MKVEVVRLLSLQIDNSNNVIFVTVKVPRI